jgi:protein SCO1/2
LLIALLLGWPIFLSIRAARNMPPHRPVLGRVPAFRLIDQYGQAFGTDELKGRAWICNFTYSHCTHVCDQMMAKMAMLQHRSRNLGTAVHLVTFSVDPERDTPAQWASYAERHRPSRRMWSFLSGAPQPVRSLLKSFQVVEGTPQSRFVLVDTDLRIRGYYDLSEENAANLLLRDAGLLINRKE